MTDGTQVGREATFTDDHIQRMLRNADQLGFGIRPEGFVLMAPNRLGPILTTPIHSWSGKLRMLLDLVLPRRVENLEEK